MKCEHFLYGQFNGVGYRLVKSTHLDDILTEESLHYLCALDGPGVIQTWLPKDQAVAVSYLSYTLDEYARRNMWNHTIVIPILDYMNIHSPDLFEPFFVRETDEPPQNLKPLRIDTK